MEFKSLKNIDVNPDDNNDGEIDDIEKQNIKDELHNLGELEEEIQKLNKEIQEKDLSEEEKKNLKKVLIKKQKDLDKLYKLLGLKKHTEKVLILKIQSELNDLGIDISDYRKTKLSLSYDNLNHTWSGQEKDNKYYTEYAIEKINNFEKLKKILLENNLFDFFNNIELIKDKFNLNDKAIFNLFKEAAETESGYQTFINIERMSGLGLKSEQIIQILIEVAKTKKGVLAFGYIKEMSEAGLKQDQIIKILKEVAKAKDGYKAFYYIKKMREAGLKPDQTKEVLLKPVQITKILKEAAKTKNGFVAFNYIKEMSEDGSEAGLKPDQIIEILKEATKTKYGSIAFYKIKEMSEAGELTNKQISEVLNVFVGENKNVITEKFVEDYKNRILERESIILGTGFKKYEQYFKNDEDYKEFVKKVLIQSSKIISYVINDVYDFWEEKKASHDKIENKIKENLKKVSTEELFSSIGNHSINYATTFNLIIEELDGRTKGKNYFEYIDIDKNLNEKTKTFLKGQVLAGLLARGLTEKAEALLKDKKNFDIIKQIINYKKSDIFGQETYLGLMVGLKDILKENNELVKFILTDSEIKKNKNFNKALKISLYLEGKKITKDGIRKLTPEEKNNEEFKEIRKKFLLDSNEYLARKNKDLVYVYTQTGGAGFYESELSTYIKQYGYKENEEVEKGKGYTILEKDGVRVTFIKNSEISDLGDILEKNNINPILLTFRGHNYETSRIIKNNKELFEKYNKSIIIDGGCRNNSAITSYREKGIKNQIVAYTSTGKGAATSIFTGRFISEYLRKSEEYKNKEITLKELAEEILPKNSYAGNFMKFPGDLMDIILKIEDGEL